MINVTVDCVVFTHDQSHVLLIQRANDPFKDRWALPGGFVDEDDKSLKEAAWRELDEETGLNVERLWQVGSWGSPDRDPRGWTVTTAFCALVEGLVPVKGQDDAKRAAWIKLSGSLDLAFDHREIINRASLMAFADQ